MKHPFRNQKKSGNSPDPSTESGREATTFAKKIEQFFSTEPQKEKVLRHEDFNAAGDVYYAGVSAGYKIAQRILWLLFVFFMVFSIVTNYQAITYDNFFYLIKDFSGAASTNTTRYETLSYESDTRQNFALYRGGIATVSPSKISIFTATGRRTLNLTSSFSSPYAVSSGKYVLVYDTSGTTFSLYNSFARVYTETLEHPVTNACMAEDGSFAIATRSASGQSVVYLYSKSFKRQASIPTDPYVFDLVLDSEQNCISILTYLAGNGTGQTKLSVMDLSELTKRQKITKLEELKFDGEFPLTCGFLESGRFALITDRYIRIFESDFEEKESSDDYSGGNITGYQLTSEGVAVSVTISSTNMIIAFDKSGNLLYNDSVTFTVSDIGIFDQYLFLQTDQGVTRISVAREAMEHLESGQGKMLIYDKKTALVCGESKAEYLIFNDR